jgi:hypothetical protein
VVFQFLLLKLKSMAQFVSLEVVALGELFLLNQELGLTLAVLLKEMITFVIKFGLLLSCHFLVMFRPPFLPFTEPLFLPGFFMLSS